VRSRRAQMVFTFFWLELPRITSNYLELPRITPNWSDNVTVPRLRRFEREDVDRRTEGGRQRGAEIRGGSHAKVAKASQIFLAPTARNRHLISETMIPFWDMPSI
jgi:hypothetical protein